MDRDTVDIVLTNDDGIDSTGLREVYEQLTGVGNVTVVAPSTDNSGVGRVLSMGRSSPLTFGDDSQSIDLSPPEYSWEVPFRPHELGYEVVGTPADCVIAAVSALDIDPDIVVSGCNPGPNVGMGVLGRSGTVSAAAEAAHLGVPGIAISSSRLEADQSDFSVESDFTRQLVQYSLETELFDTIDYLNALVPPSPPERVVVTEPAESSNVTAEVDTSTNQFTFTHTYFKELQNGHENQESPGTDRHAVEQNEASLSPLTIRDGPVESELLQTFTDQYQPRSTQ